MHFMCIVCVQDFSGESVKFATLNTTWKNIMQRASVVKTCIQVSILSIILLTYPHSIHPLIHQLTTHSSLTLLSLCSQCCLEGEEQLLAALHRLNSEMEECKRSLVSYLATKREVRMCEWVSEWVCEWVGEWVSEWVLVDEWDEWPMWSSEWVSEWPSEWVLSEWVSEWVNDRVSEWVSDRVSECMSVPVLSTLLLLKGIRSPVPVLAWRC